MTLPHWLVCGAQRSGTSSLWSLLQQNERVFVPTIDKEINYFTQEYHRGLAWYEGLFAEADPDQVPGEVSPYYMIFADQAAPRIRELLPDVRLMFILRDPVERAYSIFRFDVVRGKYPDLYDKTFERVLDEPKGKRYLANGEYHNLLRPYFDLFARDQIKVVLHEELFASVRHGMDEVFDFIGVPRAEVAVDPDWVNPARRLRVKRVSQFLTPLRRNPLVAAAPKGLRRSVVRMLYSQTADPEAMNPATRKRLAEYYRPHNERLAELLGRDLSIWGGEGSGAVERSSPAPR
jgi:Sulfotransferase domain